MFEGFDESFVDVGEVTLRVRRGGEGPPLLLLHGHPQTHVMWHRVAPELAKCFTVVCPDLRGYGDSSKPKGGGDHVAYAKRTMAGDFVRLMAGFGYDRFMVAGHDRGGRVAYRMALDHPDRVARLAVLDILPTFEHYRRTDMAFALGYWHWFFLSQPFDLPERLLQADPDAYFLRGRRHLFAPEALADYERCYRLPGTIHACCEDYRAGATIDCRLDEADLKAGRRIACPLLVLWGAEGQVGGWYDVPAVWRDWATHVEGEGLPCGHYLPEEAPEATLEAFSRFFGAP
ncbi:MAG: alpha/beta hydrolase [Geminicoccaceae bacterium]|nr:alpha/beta hydrolase [Geminicoccaceae bacterium]